MGEKKILGHIDCPACGTAKGMRITPDKNGHPFGYCEAECSAQLRIGGDSRRVAAFLKRYPWAAGQPVTETITAPAPATTPTPAAPSKQEKKAEPVTPPVPVKAARKPVANPFDFLLQKGNQA